MFTLAISNVQGKIELKLATIWRFLGMRGCPGVTESGDFYGEGTSVCERTSFEPFCVKIGWGWGLATRAVPEQSETVRQSRRVPQEQGVAVNKSIA